MTKPRGRPKLPEKRVGRGFRFSESAMETLDALVERYKGEAPSFVAVSQRMVIEALIEYAVRNELPLSALLSTEPAGSE